MKEPYFYDESFLNDVKEAEQDLDTIHLWWLGQSGFLLQWKRDYVLLDPYLSDSLTKKYANTDKPHVRMTKQVVQPEALHFIHAVSSSHNHTDHLDAETLNPLRQVNEDLIIITPKANKQFAAERLQCSPVELVGLNNGDSIHVGEFFFTAVPAAHEEIERDENGNHKYLGYIVQCGPWTIYHSGDTVRFAGMAEHLRIFSIDIAILPINGRNPERRVPGNLTGTEAAQLGKAIDAQIVIPCHFDMFEFNTVSPEKFIQECRKIKQSYRVLQNGERFNGTEI